MKKAKIEGWSLVDLWVDKTPFQSDKSVNIYGFDAFPVLTKSWASQRDRLIITIDEGKGAISLFVAKSKRGNGYVGRKRENGELRVGRIFDIVSPIYYIKNPLRGAGSSPAVKYITTYSKNSDVKSCMFFPTAVKELQVLVNGYTPGDELTKTYGKGFGVAGTSTFYESMSCEFSGEIAGFESCQVRNTTDSTGSERVAYIGGEYQIL